MKDLNNDSFTADRGAWEFKELIDKAKGIRDKMYATQAVHEDIMDRDSGGLFGAATSALELAIARADEALAAYDQRLINENYEGCRKAIENAQEELKYRG